MNALTLFSVPMRDGRLYAFVPGALLGSLARLIEDDPVWRRTSVSLHWHHAFDGRATGLKLRDRIKFKFVAATLPQPF